MFRPVSVAILLALLHTAPTVHAQSMLVDAPAGLSAEVYSSSAVEIFWLRTQGEVFYTVTRDGELLERTFGNSFFEEGLDPRTTYQYEIRSVDVEDNESEESLITVTTRGGIPETDATRPLSLRAEVYSGTALELFWRRGFPAPNNYEVARDGVVLGTTDGSSFFDDGLVPGTQYEYTVTLLDSDSPAATLTSTTNGGSLNAGGNTDDAPILENARLAVYSDTVAELLWDRPAAERGVARVEVLRNTESLGRFDATSFLDDTRLSGIEYNYSLIARDNAGNELGRVNILADDAVSPESVEFVSPILGQFNEVDIVNLVFSAFSGQAFGNDALRLPYHSDPIYSNAELLGGAPADAVIADIVCDNGGTATFDPLLFVGSTDSGWNFDFDNCLDGSELIQGELTRLVSASVQIESESVISIEGSARNAQFSGLMSRLFETPRGGSIERTMDAENLNFEFTENAETFELVNANFRYVLALPVSASIEGSFQVRSPLTQNRLLDVTIVEPFEWSGNADSSSFFENWVAFSSGSMTITAEDGTQFQVEAGDSANFIAINALPSERGGTTFFQWSNFSESLPLFSPEF